MKQNLSVVHISKTPLVGSPGFLATAQRLKGLNSEWVVLSDYPGDKSDKFTRTALPWFQGGLIASCAEQLIEKCDIVHLHNDLPFELIPYFFNLAKKARWIYHVHSPLKEGPLFISRDNDMGIPFYEKLVVAQYQPRIYPHFVPVPNIINATPSYSLRRPNEILRVLFSPTHNREGRWNDKGSIYTINVLRELDEAGLLKAVIPDKILSPENLMVLRRGCHVTIDEIITGAFHMTSLEGLCAGNIVINNADFFSLMTISRACESREFPPFTIANKKNLANTLTHLSEDPIKTAQIQLTSFNYFNKWLISSKIVDRYISIYQNVLNKRKFDKNE